MVVTSVFSNTGGAQLPDVGQLEYNGIRFSCLYHSKVTGGIVQDDAQRTTKVVEWTLNVEGVVTLNDGEINTDNTWQNIRQRLSVHAAPLIYAGNGFGNLNVNMPGGPVWDIKWGPVPKILEFTPLGQGRGAFIRWQVTVNIPELGYRAGNINPVPTLGDNVAQFNYEASVTYNDDGYSGLSVKGTLEIAMTRAVFGVDQSRSIQATVDDFRELWLSIVIDLVNFRITRRDFGFSRDKRTCQWTFEAEEIPPSGLPWGCTAAHGSMSVRQIKQGGRIAQAFKIWSCTLRCSYVVRADFPRRIAAFNFYSLLWFRMQNSAAGVLPGLANNNNAAQQQVNAPGQFDINFGASLTTGPPTIPANWFWTSMHREKRAAAPIPLKDKKAFLVDFGFDEGFYQDGKSMSFNATWVLMVELTSILAASGVWKFPNVDTGGKVWADSVARVMGPRSWLLNHLNPKADFIIDLGGGTPRNQPVFVPERNTSFGGNPPNRPTSPGD